MNRFASVFPDTSNGIRVRRRSAPDPGGSATTARMRAVPTRRILFTAVMFAVAIACVGVASATHSVIPLFAAWIPLLAVPWALTRPEAGRAGSPKGGDPGSGSPGGGPGPRLTSEPEGQEDPAP